MTRRHVKFPKINSDDLKKTIENTLHVYNRLVVPEDFAELQSDFKNHWDKLYRLIESTSAESRIWRQKNEDLIQRIIVKQQFLALQFEDKEKELLGESTSNFPANVSTIDQILLQSNLETVAPEIISTNSIIASSDVTPGQQDQSSVANDMDVDSSSTNLAASQQSSDDDLNVITSNNSTSVASNADTMGITVPISTTPIISDTVTTVISTLHGASIMATSALPLPTATQAPRHTRQELDRTNDLFGMIANLPKIPDHATQDNFQTLLDAMAKIMSFAQRHNFDQSMVEKFLIAKTIEAISTTYVMAFCFALSVHGTTLQDLREFLRQNQEYLMHGVDIRPQHVRDQTITTDNSKKAAVKAAAASLSAPGPSASRRSLSKEPRKKKAKNQLPPCFECSSIEHKLFHCPNYRKMKHAQRWLFVTTYRICPNCLDSYHSVTVCTKQGCDLCSEKHNRTLCPKLNRD